MNKTLIALIAAAVVVGGAYVAFRTSKTAAPKTETTTSETAVEPKSDNAQAPAEAAAKAQSGAYVDYSSSVIANTSGTKILFFHAPWCSQCRTLEASIKSSTIPDDVTIIKVDYDSNQALRQKYGVTIQTTLIKVDDSGKLVEKYVAYDSPTFASVKANLL